MFQIYREFLYFSVIKTEFIPVTIYVFQTYHDRMPYEYSEIKSINQNVTRQERKMPGIFIRFISKFTGLTDSCIENSFLIY